MKPSPYDICDRTIAKYGRLDLSWAGNGTSGFRLNDWLDPINAGDITTNGFITYISGNSIVCTQNHYVLTQISHQSTISWGLENVLPAGGMAIQPQYNNEVYVQRVGTQHTEADLVATITRGGNVIAKRKMHLISPGPFNAIVYQHEGQYQGILYPAMNTNVSNASSIVEVNPNCDITLSSLNLKQMDVSYSGAIPTYWSGVMYIPNNDLVYEDSLAGLTSGNIYFQLPYTGSTYDFHIYGQDAENCNSFNITLRVRPYPINLTQKTVLQISHTGTSLEVMLPETVFSESGTSQSEQFWKLQIYNTQTGLLVYEHIENSSTGQLPTTLLSKGIYTIVAKTNTSAYSTTFTIK